MRISLLTYRKLMTCFFLRISRNFGPKSGIKVPTDRFFFFWICLKTDAGISIEIKLSQSNFWCILMLYLSLYRNLSMSDLLTILVVIFFYIFKKYNFFRASFQYINPNILLSRTLCNCSFYYLGKITYFRLASLILEV